MGSTSKSKKILGIEYDIENDKLRVFINPVKEGKFTKKRILSRIAEIWDPLGICAGVHLTGKLLFQSITRLNFSWGQVIHDSELWSTWESWKKEIEKCQNSLISRSVLPPEKYVNEKLQGEVVGFSDGSDVGFGCVIYLRWKNTDESVIDVKFLGVKCKVTSIKGNTILRNELCGAVILSRMAWSATEAFKRTEIRTQMSDDITKLNTDSTTVLSWVTSPAIKFKPCVKNKIIEIQNLLPASNWRYIPTNKNKATDSLSKGCKSRDLDISVNGPKICRMPEKDWPEMPKCCKLGLDTEVVLGRKSALANLLEPILSIENYSSWKKLLLGDCKIRQFLTKIEITRFHYHRVGFHFSF